MSVESDKPAMEGNASQESTSAEGAVAPGKRISVRPGGPESLIGKMLSGRYRIERLLGEGGMGAVYQVEHTLMHKRFAVKILHPDMSRMPEVVSRFEREAMAAAHIDHPNVAAATDFGKLDDGSFFLVLEFVEGTGLRELIAQGPLDIARAMHIVRQIASALHRAHALGIVHRDLKPENVMLVVRDGDLDFVKVLDFGIAKVPVGDIAPASKAGGAITQLGMVYGTPEYMAPEQALGQEVDARADQYSLGVMAFEMLTGVRPFDNESKVKLLAMHVTSPIPSMAERAPAVVVPRHVEAIVQRLLSKESSDRFPDARELIDILDTTFGFDVRPASLPFAPTAFRSTADLSAHLPPASTTPALPIARRSPNHSKWLILAVFALALVALGVVVAFLRTRSPGVESAGVDGGLAGKGWEENSVVANGDTVTDDAVKLAVTQLAAGNTAEAISLLGPLEIAHPERADVHKQLYLAFMASGHAREAMIEAGKWIDADERARQDIKLLSDVRAVAIGGKEGEEQAFDLLETNLGSSGPDVLFDLAFGTGVHASIAARAKKSLIRSDVRKLESPAVDVSMDIYNGQGCEQKKLFFDRAREVGDARTVQILHGFSATRGCGFLGTRDCWSCMHRDGSLARTISVIQSRLR